MDATLSGVLQWGPLGVSLLLAIVAVWSLRHSASVSRSSAESAEASEIAASAAQQSAAAARVSADATMAGLNVAFAVSPYMRLDLTATYVAWGITVWCKGATVFVHRVVLQHAARPIRYAEGSDVFFHTLGLSNVEVPPEDYTGALPLRFHNGESAAFVLPDQEKPPVIGRLEVAVHYSLDGVSDPIERKVEWQGTRGKDFEESDVHVLSQEELVAFAKELRGQ